MHLFQIRRTLRNLPRYREILQVLIKFGFNDILNRIKILHVLGGRRFFLFRKKLFTQTTRPQRLRLAFEELGPTFIKLGQMLSTRYDLLPMDYIEELRKLQDQVPPFSSNVAKLIIESEFQKPLKTLFHSFEETPFAAASIAQVHRGQTHDGKSVIIKIQRPEIDLVIQKDLEILLDLAKLIVRYIPESHVFDPVGIVEEFGRWIRNELDFFQEGRNIERFREHFKSDTTIYIPQVYWEWTTSKVLTLEFVPGISIQDVEALEKRGFDRKTIAKNFTQFILKQIFQHGFFHGDPHPGNIFVIEENVICPIDFGLVGRLDPFLIQALGQMAMGLIEYDVDRMVRALFKMGMIQDEVEPFPLRLDLREYLDKYYQIPLYQLNIETVVRDMFALISRHRIRLPKDLYLMGKTLMVTQALTRSLDPEFNFMEEAKPLLEKTLFQPMNKKQLLKEMRLYAEDYKDLFGTFPEAFRSFLIKLRKGEINIHVQPKGFEPFVRELDRSTNRLALSLILASLFIASAMLLFLDKPPYFGGLSIFGLIGLGISFFLAFALTIAILRSGKL